MQAHAEKIQSLPRPPKVGKIDLGFLGQCFGSGALWFGISLQGPRSLSIGFVLSGAISKVTVIITHMRGLLTPHIPTLDLRLNVTVCGV